MSLLREYIKELLTEINLGQSYGTVNYTALVLDDVSHRKLAELSPPDWKPIAHHMTVITPPNQKFRMPSHWLNVEECVKVIAIAQNDQVMTGLVSLEELPLPMKGPAFPHITIAVNPETGGKPVMSNQFSMSDFEPISPIVVCGTIEEILR